MEAAFDLGIVRWAAWAPDLISADDWERWAEEPRVVSGPVRAPVQFVPPLLRRRCRRLPAAALHVAWRCLEPRERSDAWLVYGSRYGETATTESLLERLVRAELPSPTDFGLSVHNTPTGIFSIAAGNREPSTALAAGSSTFCHTLLEAAAQRARAPSAHAVLAVVADEPVPDVFQPVADGAPALYALALHLGGAAESETPAAARLQLRLEPAEEVDEVEEALPQGLEFIRWLFSAEEELLLRSRGVRWRLRREPGVWRERFAGAGADEALG